MGEKPTDPESPGDIHHLESSISIEKKDAVDAEVARTWSREVGQKQGKYTKLKNPLAGLSKEELLADVDAFAREKGLEDALEDLKKGALISQDPKAFESLSELTEADKELIRREKTHRWNQPFMMYFMTSTSVVGP